MTNYNSNKNKNPIYSDTGRIVGWRKGDAICKNVIASKHMLLKPRGWAWDKSIILEAEKDGCKRTIIYDKENDLVYSAPLKYFFLYGVEINRGFGTQICLPIHYWTTTSTGNPPAQQLALAI